MKAIKNIVLMTFLSSASAVRFMDTDDEMNNLVEKTAKNVYINPIIVVQAP